MSDYRSNRLAARVAARNAAHQMVNELRPKLRAALRPFIGRQVIKADGDLMKVVFAAVDPILPERKASEYAWFDKSSYILRWAVQACRTVNGETAYADATVYVGRLDEQTGQTLIEIHEDDGDLRADYTADEVLRLRDDWKKKQAIADNAFSALWPFGDSDS